MRSHQSSAPSPADRGFSLIELLVVIAIIAVLISIVLPALGRARDMGRETACRSNLHQFAVATSGFALDHREHLPGVFTWTLPDLQDWQRDWLSGEWTSDNQLVLWDHAPDAGTLFPYMGENHAVYRCPSLKPGPRVGRGVGSNGKYDYTMIGGFGGARLDRMPLEVVLVDPEPTSGSFGNAEEPRKVGSAKPVFFVEEDPTYFLNEIDCLAGSFADIDRIAATHSGSSSYVAADSSVHRWDRRFAGTLGKAFTRGPLGGPSADTLVHVGIDPPSFGWWNGQ